MNTYGFAVNVAVFISSCIVLVSCIYLVLHKDYEDGLIGRLALVLIIMASIGRSGKILEYEFHGSVSLIALLIWVGFSMFLIRHVYRFRRWRLDNSHDWRVASEKLTAGKTSKK